MKNQKPDQKPTPQQANDLKQNMEEWQQGLGQGTQAKGPMEEDKKNREKNADLNLEELQKDEYRKQLQKSKRLDR